MHPLLVIILVLMFGTLIAWDMIGGVAYARWLSAKRSDNPLGFWSIVVIKLGFLIVIARQFDMIEFFSSNAGIKVASAIIPIVWISTVSVLAYYLKNDSHK